MKNIRLTIAVLAIFGSLIIFSLQKAMVGAGPLERSVTVDVAKGISSQSVAQLLFENDVISSPLIFRILLKVTRAENQLKAGEYLFEAGSSMKEVLAKLVSGDVLYHRITIPEGYTVGQSFYLLSMEDMLFGEFEFVPNEGGMLPETYTYQKGEKRDAIVRKACQAMQKKLKKIWKEREDGLPYKNMNELLIMASIIEKETAVDAERAQVASVFVNRLRKGMKLQTDPTVIYAITDGREELKRALTRKDLAIDSPYNTYKNYGLPPTPICNPGEASLYAAAHPDETDYLYFVASGNGGHNFATTLADHNRNVATWKSKK